MQSLGRRFSTPQIPLLWTEGFYSEETKRSALHDFLQHNEEELARFIHLYIHDGATFVDDSLDVEEVELEGTHGTVSLSFYEDLRLGCRDFSLLIVCDPARQARKNAGWTGACINVGAMLTIHVSNAG